MKTPTAYRIASAILGTLASVFLIQSMHSNPIEQVPACTETQWGIGRLVFARWQIGSPLAPHEYLIGSGGTRLEKEPDHWDIRMDETVEIGLRADGVLVWRKAEKQVQP